MFLHSYSPDPILLSLGQINIYWYGLFIVAGALAAIFIASRLAPYYGLKKETIIDISFYLIIFGIIGARLYDVFLEWPYYAENPIDIFKIWQGGLAIHGAIIAGLLTVWVYSKKLKTNFFLLASILVPGLALGQAIGRWGNYFNQELFGRPTDLPWGIPISAINRPDDHLNNLYFHPTFLYESLGNLMIFGLLIGFHIWIIKKTSEGAKRVIGYKLLVIGYLILYSILRFSLEFIRIDRTPLFIGLRWPQVASLVIIAACLIYAALLYRQTKKRRSFFIAP